MLTDIEIEAVLLKAVWDQIATAANASIFAVEGNEPDSEIRFETPIHQKFFNIVLVDLLSETDDSAPLKSRTYLSGLTCIAVNPLLSTRSAVGHLEKATVDFASWLEECIEVDAWLPSINRQVKFGLSRVLFIKMVGNLSKHNFLRSFRVAMQLRSVLKQSGVDVSLEDASLALPDFYDRFHTDILNYHSSTLAEFLNNIRWGIYEYLQPEFARSIVWDLDNPPMYRYTFPPGINSKYAQQVYWDLMNDVRSEPSMRRFKVTRWLKLRY